MAEVQRVVKLAGLGVMVVGMAEGWVEAAWGWVETVAAGVATAVTAGSLPRGLNRRRIRLIVMRWPLQGLVR